MYRDDAIDLDEHDRAVGHILIGESLIGQCEAAAAHMATLDPERWRAVRSLHDDYPEIWRQLDRAHKILEGRGAPTLGYEELRPHVKSALVTPGKDDQQELDREALDDARRAVGELKLAVPGTDWKAIYRRTSELCSTPRLRQKYKLSASMIVLGFLLAIVGWFFAVAPVKRVSQREQMRQEIADVAAQRVVRIERLALVIEHICDPATAHEYVRLLVLDGQKDTAVDFAERYKARCGEDRVVENWSKAPRPRTR